MAGKQRAARSARIRVGATNLNLSEYDINDRADDIDTSTFEDSGFESGLRGIEVAEVSFRGMWDAQRNPVDSAAVPGLYPRDDLASVEVWVNITDNLQKWIFALMRVLSARNTAVIRQAVTFEASLKSQGSFTRPSGSVA